MQERKNKNENFFSSKPLPAMNERMKKLIDYYANGSVKKFSEMIKLSSSQKLNRVFNLDKRNGEYPEVSSDILSSVANMFSEVNAEWLLTGRESMLKEDGNIQSSESIQILHHPKAVEKMIQQQSIPLYNIEAAANLKTVFDNKDQNILGEISIPNVPRCDGAVYVRGDSMYPLLKSGDIIGYKEIYNFDNVIFGEMYMVAYDIEGDEFVTVKYINHSDKEGCIKLVSYNTHHDPKDIQLQRITAMALVKFSIRMNTML